MDKFTKQQKIPTSLDTNLYQSDLHTIIKHKDWDIVQEKNVVIALPYFKDEGYIIMRSEHIPTYELGYQYDIQMNKFNRFLTVISGRMEPNENPIQTLRRELYEEAGIVLSSMYPLQVEEEYFMSKGNMSKYYPFLLELNYNSYKQVLAPTDGSKSEKMSSCVRISLGDIDEIKVHDLITQYMLLKLKYEYKLK